jgi:hypothetical protein
VNIIELWIIRQVEAARRAALGLAGWIAGLFTPVYRTVVVEDLLPTQLLSKRLYIVQDDGYLEQAALLCPCGCKRVLQMNLQSDTRPCWTVTQHENGTATLHPSVWRKKDCGSHFWFRRGRVQWC